MDRCKNNNERKYIYNVNFTEKGIGICFYSQFHKFRIFLIKTDNALCFLLSNVAVYFIVWIVLELNCRKLIGSKNDGNTFSFDELIKNIKAGILLTVGNLSSVVLTSMDRWFVKALMTTLAFAQYSFAVSMENFMNVAVTPVTTTLYNYFCKATDEVKVRKARNYVMIFAALIVSCAFPARFILEVYLTKSRCCSCCFDWGHSKCQTSCTTRLAVCLVDCVTSGKESTRKAVKIENNMIYWGKRD